MLVTLEQVKSHLHVLEDDSETNDNLDMKRLQAEEIIADYLKSRFDATWTLETVPGDVHAAILKVVESLVDGEADVDPITPGVASLLMRRRDPAMA